MMGGGDFWVGSTLVGAEGRDEEEAEVVDIRVYGILTQLCR